MKIWLSDRNALGALQLPEATQVVSSSVEADVWLLVDASSAPNNALNKPTIRYFSGPEQLRHHPHGAEPCEIILAGASADEWAVRLQRATSSQDSRWRSLTRLFAHDLNNPLTAMRLLTSMLVEDLDDEQLRSDANDVLAALDCATMLVEELASFAKQHPVVHPTPGGVDILALLARVCSRPSLKPRLDYRPPGVTVSVDGSSSALNLGLTEMLHFATRVSSPTVPVQVTCLIDEQGVQVVARGMLDAPLPKVDLTSPFSALALRQAKIPAIPTGLAIADWAAKAHAGAVTAQTQPPSLTLSFFLPHR